MADLPEQLVDLESWSPLPISSQRTDKATKYSGDYIGSRIKPVDLYAYLKTRFGGPNGLTMISRTNDVDNVVQWHWSLGVGDWQVDFIQLNDRLEISIKGPRELSKLQIDFLVSSVKNDFARLGPALTATRAQFENWNLFVNPFGRIAMVVDQSIARLAELNLTPPELPPYRAPKRKFNQYMELLGSWSQDVNEAYNVCSTLRFHLPVMCEALANLVLFVFVRDEVRSDPRLFQSVLRSEIDIRVRQLHLHCTGFRSPIYSSDVRFKAFHSIMNARNDTLHANVDVAALKVGTMQFDLRWIPLFPDSDSLFVRLANARLLQMTPDELRKDHSTVLGFIDLIHENL